MQRKSRHFTYNKPQLSLQVISFVFFALLCVVTIYPVWDTIVGSVMPLNEYVKTPIKIIPRGISLNAYTSLLKDRDVMTPLKNSAFVTVIGTVLSLFVTSMAAYALSRKSFFGRGVLMRIIVMTMLFSGGLIPTYMAMKALSLTNKLWVCILLPLVNSYYLIIMRTYFAGIPDGMVESVKIDGANDMLIYLRLILPTSMPIIATMTITAITLTLTGIRSPFRDRL